MRGPLVVVGDALLDIDLDGVAGRLSPDAPVPVLDSLVEHPRPGGAGLAALMAARDGHDVVLVTGLGDDAAGRRLRALLDAAGVEVVGLPTDAPTPEKRRVRAGGQPLLRLDTGGEPGRFLGMPEGLAETIGSAGAVLVADYGRGVTSLPEVRELVAGLPRRVPVVWDPHPRGAVPVPGVHLVTPNEGECAHFGDVAGIEVAEGSSALAAAGRRADGLVAHWKSQAVTVTLGARGALLSYGSGAPVVTPAPPVRCIDACGAGDRFAVTAALSLGHGRVITEAVSDAVVAAADHVASGGAGALMGTGEEHASAPAATVEDLVASVTARGGTVVATGGCFDLLHAGHVATLHAARRLGDCLVVCLNSDDSVRRLKGEARPLVPAHDRARVLEALEFVDAVVVFDEDTPVEVLKRIRPHVWAKGGDYAGRTVPEAEVLQEWGGQAVVLPYLEGRSTTKLVQSAADRTARQDRTDKEIAR